VAFGQETGLVFTTTVATVIEPRNLARVLDALIVEVGARIRLHDMRHTSASLLLARGVPARVVMEVLGHSQLGITMNLYSHVMPSALRERPTQSTASSVARPRVRSDRCCHHCCQGALRQARGADETR
jgi:site-specific recombinase XerD